MFLSEFIRNYRSLIGGIALFMSAIEIVLAARWFINSDSSYEPLIIIIGVIIGLLGVPTIIDLALQHNRGTSIKKLDWAKTIDKSVRQFQQLHFNKHVELINTRIKGSIAIVQVSISSWPGYTPLEIHELKINKDGEILRSQKINRPY